MEWLSVIINIISIPFNILFLISETIDVFIAAIIGVVSFIMLFVYGNYIYIKRLVTFVKRNKKSPYCYVVLLVLFTPIVVLAFFNVFILFCFILVFWLYMLLVLMILHFVLFVFCNVSNNNTIFETLQNMTDEIVADK